MATTTTPSKEAICSAVDALFDESVDFLKQLCAIDSTLGSKGEKEVQEFMFDAFKNLDSALKVDKFVIQRSDIEKLRGFSPADWTYDDSKLTVVAAHEPKSNNNAGKTLILNGHVDVVPVGEHDPWTTPAFTPTIRDGKLYGRGTGDMKSGVAAFYYAYKALLKTGFKPASKIWMQTVTEEECTGNGALSCLANGYDKADAVIIPEPFPFIVTAQLGVMWLKITVTGKPAHVLNTSAGKNAIESSFILYEALKKVEARWNEGKLRENDTPKPHPAYSGMNHPINFNLGKINGGNWASSVPSECVFEVRFGVFPGVELKEARAVIEETLAAAAKEHDIHYVYEWRGFQAEGCVMDKEQEMFKLLGKLHEDVTAKSPIFSPITATTDARYFFLYSGIPSTCYGCLASSIHGIDEWVCLDSYKNVTKVLALFIAEWCGLEAAN